MRGGRAAATALGVAGLLAGCAQGMLSTQASRIGPDDGTDSCRPQLVALDSTGNFFGAQILTGAAIGAAGGALMGGLLGGNWKTALIGAGAGTLAGGSAAYWLALRQQSQDEAVLRAHVQGDLSHENAQIDRTQLAFDQLMDCRFGQARAITASYHARRIDRSTAEADMAKLRDRLHHDVALARQIDRQINDREQQFVQAAEKLQPDTTTAIAAATPAAKPVKVRRAVALKLRPAPTAPDVGQIARGEAVTATPSGHGYAYVEAPDGSRGYALATALTGVPLHPPASGAGAAGPDDLRTLAGSNAARRDSFAQSVAVADAASNTGFQSVD